jgi:CheY-like chemotaxis protein
MGMENLLHSALGSNIQIKIVESATWCPARIDVSELENALLNLAVNARDAMPNGGVLTIEVNNVQLNRERQTALGLTPERRAKEFVLISVSDTGIGMDEKVVSQAFDPFFTTKDIGKGSGLGLSMVYGFIAQLEGHTRIRSELGCGTTVELFLPREIQEKVHTELQPRTTDIRGGNERILVVEDDELVRQQVTMHLAALGYETVAAKDGIEALEVLQTKHTFDLLFTDILMPRGLNGVDLAKQARILCPELPVLFTSGYAEGIALEEGSPDEKISLLAKPYRPQELAGRIRTILDQAHRH